MLYGKEHIQLTISKNRYYRFVGIYTFTYAALGMLLPLLGQYLDSIGFSGLQIGTITASATTISILASPTWGYISHHSKESTRVLALLCVLTVAFVLGISQIRPYLVFLLAYATFAFFQSPIMPLTDAMTLQARVPFGAVRKWGAIGFAVGVFFAGQIAELTGLIIIFPLCALGYFTALILIESLRISWKKDQKTERDGIAQSDCVKASHAAKKTPGSYFILFQNKKLMSLLVAAFFVCGTNVANNTYFGFLYKDVGGSIAGIGFAFLLMCSGEAPFMAWADRLAAKFTTEKLILFSMIISALRYLWYSTGPSPHLLLGTFFLQGMVNGIVLVEFVRYITKLVDPSIIAMSMTLYQAISSNCSTILCQMAGGIILDHFGGAKVYLFFSFYNLIGIILYVGFGLHRGINDNDSWKKEFK